MANSNVQIGFPHKQLSHFQSIQSEIDTFVRHERDVVFEDQQYGNSYAVDLDSVNNFVLGEDVHTARIFPKKKSNPVRTAYAETTSQLDTHLITVLKKILELVLLGGKFLVVFLVKFDLFCERVLSKGSVYVQESVAEVSRKKEMFLEQLREAEAKKNEVLEYKVPEVQQVSVQSHDAPPRIAIQKPAPVYAQAPITAHVPTPTRTQTPEYTAVPRPVYTPTPVATRTPTPAHIEPASPVAQATITTTEAPNLSVYFYAVSILYRELRFGKKN